MRNRKTRRRAAAATGIAIVAIGAMASSASAAVRQSSYSVTRIDQSSSVRASLGSSSWNVASSFRYTARRGSNRVVFDYPTRNSFDPFTKGGTNPRYGVLQGVKAQRASQSGNVANSREACGLPGDVPRAERELTVRFYRTSVRAKTVYVEVNGPDALERIDDEDDDGRIECLDQMPSLGTVAPKRVRGDDYSVSFAVPRSKFRKAAKGRKKTLVLRGTARTPLTANGNPVGQTIVKTKLTLRLIGSR